MARIGAAAIAQRGVRRRYAKLLRTACGSMEDVYLSYRLPKQQFNSNHPWSANSLMVMPGAGVESEPAQPKSRPKTKVKLNFGLSPDFSVQLKVSLSESLSERLSQKLKWPSTSYNSLQRYTVCY